MLHAEHEDGSATNGKGARACDGHTLSPSSPKSSAIANMAPRHAPSSSDLPLARPTGAVGKDTAAGSPNTASMELASPNRGGPLKTVKHADPTAELSPSHMPSSFIPGVVAIPMPLERNEPPPATDGTPTRSSSRPSMDRPLVALTLHCSQLYHDIDKSHCERQRKIIGAKNHNDGFDEEDGHYAVICRERIIDRFLVLDTLGKGSFGTVVKCYDEKRKEIVALKISRCGAKFREQAKSEMDILTQINRKKTCEKFVVKFLKAFDWKKHLILVFPRLSHNLYQVLAFTQFQGCTLDLVRKIAFQLIHALQCLESHQPCPIIHCDLKPENIMLVNRQRSGIRLIDFGSACYHDRRSHRYIQSRFYRSPEVILGLPYTTAIDRWSLGCVLVELYRGTPLFEGRSEEEQLSLFEYLLGPVPNEMVESSPKKDKFFFTLGGAKLSYRLKRSLGEGGTLSSWLRDHHKPKEDPEQKDHFITFIEQILRYEPEQRLSCKAALEHPFITEIFRSLKLPQPTEETK